MKMMKIATFFAVMLTAISSAAIYDRYYVYNVFVYTSTEYWFQLYTQPNYSDLTTWYVVTQNDLGPFLYEKMYSQLLDALHAKKYVRVETNGTTLNVLKLRMYRQ